MKRLLIALQAASYQAIPLGLVIAIVAFMLYAYTGTFDPDLFTLVQILGLVSVLTYSYFCLTDDEDNFPPTGQAVC